MCGELTINNSYPSAADIAAQIRALPRSDTASIRAHRRTLTKELASAPASTILEIADTLLDEPEFVYHFVAYELIHYHKAAFASLRAKHLTRLGRVLGSWYHVDTFAPYLSGPAWREGQIDDAVIHGWAKSKDRWWRRAALVSTIGLNNKARGGRGDTPRTLAVCELLIHDRDDMVVKAMSWALRELSKRDPKAIEQFATKHRAALAPRVLREVGNKLRTGLKTPKNR